MNTTLHRTLLLLATLLTLCACSNEAPDPTDAVADSEQAGIDAGSGETSTGLDREEAGSGTDSGQGGITAELAWQMAESPLTTDLSTAYLRRCSDDDGAAMECEMLRSLVVIDVVMALEEIERARDQRGAAEALEALSLTDEPEILVAGLRILGQFPDTPGAAGKALPLLLESPYLQVQQMAARVLAANPDPTLAAVGAYWGGNHSTLYAEDPYQEYPDFAPHYADMGFPVYAGAEWFSPADSDRSVGWSTGDDFVTVSAWLAEELGAEGLDYRAWVEQLSQQSTAMFQVDPDKQAEVQRLIEEWIKTQDMAVLEKMNKLQEEMSAPVKAASEIADQGVSGFGPPNAVEAQEQIRYFLAEERDGHVVRLVIAYPLTSLGRTVIQHAWNLAYYPSAWPPEEEGAAQDQ